MPRLSNPTDPFVRTELSGLWRRSPAFVHLDYADQYHLHQFFAFTIDLSADAALAYRTAVTTRYPSLPQQAGRAMARPTTGSRVEVAQAQPTGPMSPRRRGPRLLSVHPLANPEPDLQRLAQVVLEMARDHSDRPDAFPGMPASNRTSRRRRH